MTALDPIVAAVAGLPRDRDSLVFEAPWQAQALALALALHERGVFTWSEWAAILADEIRRAQNRGDPDAGDTYYRHWLAALERLAIAKGAADPSALDSCRTAWHRAARRTPHGLPIELATEDFYSEAAGGTIRPPCR